MNKKAEWIAKQSGYNADDVFDVLEGNITAPRSLVQDVTALSEEYDADKAKNAWKEKEDER